VAALLRQNRYLRYRATVWKARAEFAVGEELPDAQRDQFDRTSFPGLAPVSWPFSKIGAPEQIVMS
jgi:hypothetical protein